VAALALAAALLAAAPSAGAKRVPRVIDAFLLKGTNGYRLAVLGFFQPGYGESSEVIVAVGRKGQSALYRAPGVVTKEKVEADLGSLGEIDVAFRPSGKIGVAHPSCDPKYRMTYEKGTYVGTIEFRGEEGYTQVSAERARFWFPLADFGCPSSATGEAFGGDLPGARLRARTRFESGRLVLQANQNRPGQRVRVQAELTERRGEIEISREAGAVYPADSFQFAPDLRTALLAPPAPFSGTGLFRREARPAGRWTGNLRVDFPGRPDVPLVGSRFGASLRHARLNKETFTSSRPNLSAWPLGSN
jgi:hypothetical protein